MSEPTWGAFMQMMLMAVAWFGVGWLWGHESATKKEQRRHDIRRSHRHTPRRDN